MARQPDEDNIWRNGFANDTLLKMGCRQYKDDDEYPSQFGAQSGAERNIRVTKDKAKDKFKVIVRNSISLNIEEKEKEVENDMNINNAIERMEKIAKKNENIYNDIKNLLGNVASKDDLNRLCHR